MIILSEIFWMIFVWKKCVLKILVVGGLRVVDCKVLKYVLNVIVLIGIKIIKYFIYDEFVCICIKRRRKGIGEVNIFNFVGLDVYE